MKISCQLIPCIYVIDQMKGNGEAWALIGGCGEHYQGFLLKDSCATSCIHV